MAKTAKFHSVVLGLVWGAAALGDVVHVPADHSTIQAAPNLSPEGRSEASDAALDEWEQLAEVSENIGAVSTWHVDDDNCPEPGSGTAADPFCLIQDCIDAAMDGDECVVAPGTYFENINFLGKAITLHSTDPSDPAVVAATIIDAGGNGSVVICETNEGSGTVINGFTIAGGVGTEHEISPDVFRPVGGGLYNFSSSPMVANCTFSGNMALLGGGMYNFSSSPTVANCTFNGNNAFSGGGMFNTQSISPTVTNCTFSGNTVVRAGGGMYNDDSNPTVTNCTFSGNTSTSLGGGMLNGGISSPTVSNCTFAGNSAERGGGMYNINRSLSVTNCTFIGNTATTTGGGMYNFFNSSLSVTNSTFIGNTANLLSGGGMTNVGGSPTVTNCTFDGNTANSSGGGMFNGSSSPTVSNCTFSGNDADHGRALAFVSLLHQPPSDLSMTNCVLWDGGDEVWHFDNSMINIAYSDVQGGWPGEGNIDVDPLFIDPANGDFRLSAGSPCIDAGDNTAVPEGIVTDLGGNPRFVDDPNTDDTGFGDPPIVDIGAYEFRDPCADDDGRVTICHVPPGNPDNAHTITVGVNAVPAHLAHGDYCGPCEADLSAHAGTGTKIDGKK